MSWKSASLSGFAGGHIEVKVLLQVLTSMLNQFFVNYAPRGWVNWSSFVVFHKESLGYSFIDDHHSNLRNFRTLIFDYFCYNSLKLRDLLLKDYVSHSITYTISENDKVGWDLLSVVSSKCSNSSFNTRLHLLADNFLSFLLDDVIRIILTHSSINRSRKSYY